VTVNGGETTRERVLRVAAELFAAKGYGATSVAEVAAAANLGKGALYHHIQSKEQLLYEISKRHVEEPLVDGEEILQRDLPADEKLRLLSRRQMRVIADHLPEITVYFREGHYLSGQRQAELQVLRDRWEDVWRTCLQQGVDEGVLRTADPITVKGVLGIFNYSWVWLHADGSMSPDEIGDRLADLVLRGQLRTS
jgi:AcrR family transcriptional regulator